MHALDHGEVAQQREGDDVFITQARTEVVGRADERHQRRQVGVQAGEEFVGAGEVFRKVAVLRAFFRGVVGARRFGCKFGQADAGTARREQLVAVGVYLVPPRLYFRADGVVKAFAARVFVKIADDVEAFAHRRAVCFDEDRHHFFADEADGGRFVVVGEDGFCDVKAAQADDHARTHAEGAVVVVVEFHHVAGLRLGELTPSLAGRSPQRGRGGVGVNKRRRGQKFCSPTVVNNGRYLDNSAFYKNHIWLRNAC